MAPRTRIALAIAAILSAGIACGSEPSREGAQADAPGPAMAETAAGSAAAALAVATELDVRNARMPLPGLITAGQPSEEQVEALLAAGVTHFISR